MEVEYFAPENLTFSEISKDIGHFINGKISEEIKKALLAAKILEEEMLIKIESIDKIGATLKCQNDNENILIKNDNFNNITQKKVQIDCFKEGIKETIPELIHAIPVQSSHNSSIIMNSILRKQLNNIVDKTNLVDKFIDFENILIDHIRQNALPITDSQLLYLRHYTAATATLAYNLVHQYTDSIGMQVQKSIEQISQTEVSHITFKSEGINYVPDYDKMNVNDDTQGQDFDYSLFLESDNKKINVEPVSSDIVVEFAPQEENTHTDIKSCSSLENIDYSSLISIWKNHNFMSSSQIDKTLITCGINTINNFSLRIDSDVINILNSTISTNTPSVRAISLCIIHNLDTLFHDIQLPDGVINLLENIAHFDGKNAPRLFLNIFANELKSQGLPLLGQILLVYDIVKYALNLCTKRKIVNASIQGFEINMEITGKMHGSLSRIGHKYSAHIVIPLLDIDIRTSEYNHSKDAEANGEKITLIEIKKKSFYCTGLPYEAFLPDNPFNEPKTFYELFRNKKFTDYLFHKWCDLNNLSDEDKDKLEAYYFHNGGDEDSTYWDRHNHENPVTFLYNYFCGKDPTMTPDEYQNKAIRIKDEQSKETRQNAVDFETNERGDFDKGTGHYARTSVFIYANLQFLLDDISIGNFCNTGVQSVESVTLNTIVYFDKEVNNILSNPLKYSYDKLSILSKTYQQIYLTRELALHLTTLAIYTDIPLKMFSYFISPNIGILSGLLVSRIYENTEKGHSNLLSRREKIYNITTNAIKVNISAISNYLKDKFLLVYEEFVKHNTTSVFWYNICNSYDKIVALTGKFFALVPDVIVKILKFKAVVFIGHYIPGLLILTATRIIKYYAIDKPKSITQNMIHRLKSYIAFQERKKYDKTIKLHNAVHLLKNKPHANPYRRYVANKIINTYNPNKITNPIRNRQHTNPIRNK